MSLNENLGLCIGNNIKALRKTKHITQEKLSELSGVSVNTIRNIEQGGWPSENSLTSISNALNVEAKILLGSPQDKLYLREEVKTQLEVAVESAVRKILENPAFTNDHIEGR